MPNVINTVETPISRQYVGARYVPIFDGTWDNTKDYAPLTVVSYEGNSYTSRTYVPSGIDIANETYWALSGNYNAQVEAYRQAVFALSNNVGNISHLNTSSHVIVDALNEILDDVNDVYDTTQYYNKLIQAAFTNFTQDCDVYDGKLFGMGGDGVLKVKDIATNTVLATVNLDGTDKPHGNSVCFGKKLNNSDPYPVLYINGYNGVDGDGNTLDSGLCYVYKIYADFSTELIQKITIGFTNNVIWEDSNYWYQGLGGVSLGNFIVDIEHNYLYVETSHSKQPSTRIFKFLLPSLSDAAVTLNTQDIIEYFDVPFYTIPQGAKYHKNKLYLTFGHVSEYGYTYISVIDLQNKCQITCMPLTDDISEVESVIFYENELYVAGNSGEYFLNIPDFTIYGNIGNPEIIPSNNNRTLCDAIASYINSINDKLKTNVITLAPSDINTINCSNGTVMSAGFTFQIIYNKLSVAQVSIVIRLQDVDKTANRPTLTLTDNKFKDIPEFYRTVPACISRPTAGSAEDTFIVDGGACYHSNNNNTITITLNAFASQAPDGYLVIVV